MRYLLLIYSDESRYATMTPDDMGALMGEYAAFHEEVAGSGVFEAAHRLKPTPMATTLRVREGQDLVTDGPFAETKEQLGGYYLIDVPNLDEAMKWARKIPTSRYGSIEIRPVWEEDEPQ